jgi:hypothetical protein
MKIELNWPDSVPVDHIDIPFLQGMLDRMATGYFNYGHMRRWQKPSNSLENIKLRLEAYEKTQNTEFLMDAANFSMMEFAVPNLPGAFFKSTTKSESPGAMVDGKLTMGKEDYGYYEEHSFKKRREGD